MYISPYRSLTFHLLAAFLLHTAFGLSFDSNTNTFEHICIIAILASPMPHIFLMANEAIIYPKTIPAIVVLKYNPTAVQVAWSASLSHWEGIPLQPVFTALCMLDTIHCTTPPSYQFDSHIAAAYITGEHDMAAGGHGRFICFQAYSLGNSK